MVTAAGSSGDGRGIHEPHVVAAVEVDIEEPELPGTEEVVPQIDPEVHIYSSPLMWNI